MQREWREHDEGFRRAGETGLTGNGERCRVFHLGHRLFQFAVADCERVKEG